MTRAASLLYRAYAKVNFTLEVLGRRPDGYHEIASLAHTVGLADLLGVGPAEHLECVVEGLDLVGEENIALRAARVLAAATGSAQGARLSLVKHIPAAAGLGGGSSDAATALVALDRLWGTRLPGRRLAELAAELGADVPFFLRGGAAVMRGRGERLEPLPPSPPQWLVVVVPRHAVATKTATLYRALSPRACSDGAATDRAAARLRAGLPLRDADLANAFEAAARNIFPGLDALWRAAEQRTCRRFHLSGAGPALFALSASRQEALRLAGPLAALGEPVRLARTVRKGRARARMSYP